MNKRFNRKRQYDYHSSRFVAKFSNVFTRLVDGSLGPTPEDARNQSYRSFLYIRSSQNATLSVDLHVAPSTPSEKRKTSYSRADVHLFAFILSHTRSLLLCSCSTSNGYVVRPRAPWGILRRGLVLHILSNRCYFGASIFIINFPRLVVDSSLFHSIDRSKFVSRSFRIWHLRIKAGQMLELTILQIEVREIC